MKITPVAFRRAPDHLIHEKMASLRAKFAEMEFDVVTQDPDVIYFLSGGSEQEATSLISRARMTILLAGFMDNAFAAAMEVKAWADRQGHAVILLSVDEAVRGGLLQRYNKVCQSFRMLRGQRAGLIGNISHWLVASGLPFEYARQRFGVDIEQYSWDKLPSYTAYGADPEFLKLYRGYNIEHIEAEAGVYGFLKDIIGTHKLDALTLECFDMVNDHSVTACLSLALLNSRGIVAGCEGDLVSMLGMMLVRALTGKIPWMANISGFYAGRVIMAHCTVPLSMVSKMGLVTHFETGKSAAIKGHIAGREFTLFRLGMDLDKAYIARCQVIYRPDHSFACRTQTEIQLAETDMKLLLEHPLGNHHLLIPGDCVDLLRLACAYTKIAVVN